MSMSFCTDIVLNPIDFSYMIIITTYTTVKTYSSVIPLTTFKKKLSNP